MLPKSGLLLLGPGFSRSGGAVVAWRFRGRMLPGLEAFAFVVSSFGRVPMLRAFWRAPLHFLLLTLHFFFNPFLFLPISFLPHVQLNHGDMTPRIVCYSFASFLSGFRSCSCCCCFLSNRVK